MGLMQPVSLAPPSLIVTPHPVTLEGQRTIAATLERGENLGGFLARAVPEYGGDSWEVRINGVVVPHEVMDRVRPKHGTVIEVRGVVGKTVLMIVALVALTVFTAGIGTAMVSAGYGALAVGLAKAAIYAVGSLLINKVLGPKKPKASESDAGSVFSLGAPRNQARPNEPLGLLFGSMRIAPDVASNAYTWYEANDQYLAVVLTPGINVDRFDALYLGDALLSGYEGVQTYTAGFSGMPQQDIPLYSNADTISGGVLEAEKGHASPWVERTSSLNTIRLQVDVDFRLFDTTSKGKPKENQETIQVEYRPVGTASWLSFGNYDIASQSQKQQRRSYTLDTPEGQYDVRMRIAGRNTDGSGATSDFTWNTLVSIQADRADYAGIPRIGIKMKATGQVPDEIRCVVHSRAMPIWRNGAWSMATSRETGTSNPGAQMLQYARGFRDEHGKLIAGIGLPDEQIDIEALKGFMQHCDANGYQYDYWVQEVRSHDEVLDAIALAGFGQKTWAGGRFSVSWAADNQPLSGVVNMATIKKAQFQVDYTLANAADGIEFTYLDRRTWTPKTLRVPAPGVQTMLNPAQVQGEGVTDEAHAAKLARYHLGQSIFQFKEITYSTDIEHLSYRRMSMLALQHDLTQWGYGGRVVSATRTPSDVVIELDEPVPPPPAGNAYIGLRIPGELVYRVFQVRSFVGTQRRLHLVEPWPADAPLPGNTDANPAHDTIWIYDFKQTPGYRVRVTGIEPESDLKGASVTCVPEGPEFWVYVETGQYIAPPNASLLQTRPVASNLRVTEQQVVQGNTVFTTLTTTFDVSGPVDQIVVKSDLDGNDVLEEVATTRTRTATWRIPGPGKYAIIVRPYNAEGQAGVAVSGTYTTTGAGSAPVNVDKLTIDDQTGGIRRYSWSFEPGTIQSPDFAGVQIRYLQGSVALPNWSDMEPLGDDDGYHATAFESTLPPAGQWTFAVRAVNTSGNLSNTMLTVQKALSNNLGQEIVKVVQQLTANELRLTEAIVQVDQYSEAVIQQEITISQINGREVENRAYIAQLQETKVDAEQAKAIVMQQVGLSVGDLTATVQQQSGVIANISGDMAAFWNTKVEVTVNGKRYLAGIALGIDAADGVVQSEIAMLADRFVFLNSVGDDAAYYYPFEIVGGVVYANEAIIRDGSISNAKIGNFIQSNNFQWNPANGVFTGWRIEKDGSARFGGDVEVRGNIYGNKIIGQVQQKVVVSWSGAITAESGQNLVQFVLGEPLVPGESHVPLIQLTIDIENTGGDPARGVWFVDRLEGSSWVTVKSKNQYLGGNEDDSVSVTVPDASTNVGETYRVRVGNGGLRSGNFRFTAVGGIALGVR